MRIFCGVNEYNNDDFNVQAISTDIKKLSKDYDSIFYTDKDLKDCINLWRDDWKPYNATIEMPAFLKDDIISYNWIENSKSIEVYKTFEEGKEVNIRIKK